MGAYWMQARLLESLARGTGFAPVASPHWWGPPPYWATRRSSKLLDYLEELSPQERSGGPGALNVCRVGRGGVGMWDLWGSAGERLREVRRRIRWEGDRWEWGRVRGREGGAEWDVPYGYWVYGRYAPAELDFGKCPAAPEGKLYGRPRLVRAGRNVCGGGMGRCRSARMGGCEERRG